MLMNVLLCYSAISSRNSRSLNRQQVKFIWMGIYISQWTLLNWMKFFDFQVLPIWLQWHHCQWYLKYLSHSISTLTILVVVPSFSFSCMSWLALIFKADFHSVQNIVRSTFSERFLFNYKQSSGTNLISCGWLHTFQKKGLAKHRSRDILHWKTSESLLTLATVSSFSFVSRSCVSAWLTKLPSSAWKTKGSTGMFEGKKLGFFSGSCNTIASGLTASTHWIRLSPNWTISSTVWNSRR